MSRFQRTIIFSFFLCLGFTCRASQARPHTISNVIVAEYKNSDEHVAEPLTVGVLHQHGIMAGGAGLSGWMSIAVPPNQVEQAHRILQNELAGLNQKQRDSFWIVWVWDGGGAGALDFLRDIPQLKMFKANTPEAKFLGILQRQKTRYIKRTVPGWTTYWVRPNAGVTVFISFKSSQCSSVGRLNGLNPI